MTQAKTAAPHPACSRLAEQAGLSRDFADRIANGERSEYTLMIWPVMEREPGLLALPTAELEQILSGLHRFLGGDSRHPPAAVDRHADADSGPDITEDRKDNTTACDQQPTKERELALNNPPPESDGPVTGDVVVRSDFGGLLMLINILLQLNIIEMLCTDAATRERPLGWLLERLAMMLTSVPDDDAVLAVFSGRNSDQPTWHQSEADITPAETAVLEVIADSITSALRDQLPQVDVEQLTDWLCQRTARLEMTPGQVTACFDMQYVSADIRRAGLDLDPDFVPWLGITVRFEYE